MSTFAVATLQAFDGPPYADQNLKGPVINVQFNPATLRLQMANNVDMKKAFGNKPATQYTGTSSSSLSFDLTFDTADDDGGGGAPVDVRKLVGPLYSLLLPTAPATGSATKKAVPPVVQFVYGVVRMKGIVIALNVDYELFASEGVPLRAKAAVTIKEMDPEYLTGAYGSGANRPGGEQDTAGLRGANAGPPAPGSNRPGSPSGPDTRSAAALAGESAADLLSRFGLDAAAWKALDLRNLNPLSLPGGTVLDLPSNVGASLGVTAGVMVGAPASAGSQGAAGGPTAVDAGHVAAGGIEPAAVTAAGGLQRAVEGAAQAAAGAQAAANRAGFETPGTAGPVTVAAGTTTGPTTFDPGSALRAAVPPRSEDPPVIDRRRVTFGLGVPLRDRFGPSVRYADVVGRDVPTSGDPTVPRWRALAPAGSSTPAGIGRVAGCGCGCTGIRTTCGGGFS